MIPSRLLSRYPLTLVLLGVEAGSSRVNEPASRLSELLVRHQQAIWGQPRNDYGFYIVSQELVDEVKAALDLLVDNLADLSGDLDAYKSVLESLNFRPLLSYPGAPNVKDYSSRYQDPGFLYNLGLAYFCALDGMVDIVSLLSDTDGGTLSALAEFLRADIGALLVSRQVELYSDNILGTVLWQAHQGAVQQGIKQVEECKQIICTDCEVLVTELADLLDQMVEELGRVLASIDETRHDATCQLLRRRLDYNFGRFSDLSPGKVNVIAAVFESKLWGRPLRALASAQIRMYRKILEFGLGFPRLDHDESRSSEAIARDFWFRGTFHDGPPLIKDDVISEGAGDSVELLRKFRETVKPLKEWIFSLYLDLRPDGNGTVSHDQAETWLGKIEGTLILILEAVNANDERQEKCMLVILLYHFGWIALNIERALRLLYAPPRRLERGKGKLGYFLVRLRQIMAKVLLLEGGPGVKNARATQGAETWRDESGRDVQRGDIESEGDCILRASDVA